MGLGYFAGALVPVLPVLFGAHEHASHGASPAGTDDRRWCPTIVAFLSGMDVRRRIAQNALVTGIAIVVTYSIGLAAKRVWGIAL